MTRLAMIGYGKIAEKHLAAFRAQGAEFVACCNRSPEGRQRAERDGNIPRSYARIDEMLDRERPQGVVCCASMPQIYGAALEVLGQGIPTLLEKPPGTTIDEYHGLCALAESSATPVMVGLNRRHYSVVRKAIDDAGGFRAITAVSVEWSEDARHLVDRISDPQEVSRMALANTLHGLDLITFLAGAVDEPSVLGLDLGQPGRWIMALQGVSRHGTLVTFSSTRDSPCRWRLSFSAQGRRYVFSPLETCQVTEFGVSGTRAIEPDDVDAKFKPGFYRQAHAFLQMIETREVPVLHGLESAGMAMVLADQLTRACTGHCQGVVDR
jgi:predicted dehydrogenase